MNRLRLLSMLFLVSTAALQAQAPSAVVSSWSFSGSVQGVTWDEDCAFTVDAAHKLTGTCKGSGVDYPTTGVFDGTAITFTHAGEYEGSQLTLTFKGKVATDGTISGDVDVAPGDVSGTFTGKPKAAVAK